MKKKQSTVRDIRQKPLLKNGSAKQSEVETVLGKTLNLPTEMALLKKIALHIKQIRKASGVSQEQFQSDTNIHIARIETGKHNISLNTLFRICNYFEVSLADFFEDLNKNKP